MLDKAIAIAEAAHAGQKDKAGKPYISHVYRVMDGVQGENAKIVAAFHDLIEDCPDWTFDRLAAEGFGSEIIDAVKAITKMRGQAYAEYLARVKGDRLARLVKLADLADNMRIERMPTPGPKDFERLEIYRKAMAFLES